MSGYSYYYEKLFVSGTLCLSCSSCLSRQCFVVFCVFTQQQLLLLHKVCMVKPHSTELIEKHVALTESQKIIYTYKIHF